MEFPLPCTPHLTTIVFIFWEMFSLCWKGNCHNVYSYVHGRCIVEPSDALQKVWQHRFCFSSGGAGYQSGPDVPLGPHEMKARKKKEITRLAQYNWLAESKPAASWDPCPLFEHWALSESTRWRKVLFFKCRHHDPERMPKSWRIGPREVHLDQNPVSQSGQPGAPGSYPYSACFFDAFAVVMNCTEIKHSAVYRVAVPSSALLRFCSLQSPLASVLRWVLGELFSFSFGKSLAAGHPATRGWGRRGWGEAELRCLGSKKSNLPWVQGTAFPLVDSAARLSPSDVPWLAWR